MSMKDDAVRAWLRGAISRLAASGDEGAVKLGQRLKRMDAERDAAKIERSIRARQKSRGASAKKLDAEDPKA